jgi:hypothetical protein
MTAEIRATKLSAVSRKRIAKLATFIKNLKSEKLDMGQVAYIGDSGNMDPKKCNSAGCAMGWSPIVFPDLLEYRKPTKESKVWDIRLKRKKKVLNYEAISEVLGIPDDDAAHLFCSGRTVYDTPAQVSAGLLQYAKDGMVPPACFEVKESYLAWIAGRVEAVYPKK